MSQERSLVETEFDDNVVRLDEFIEGTKAFTPIKSLEDVVKRYVRDCTVLKEDMFSKACPSHGDINDFNDRFNSLEIQFHNLKNDHK